jgi:hypothetical protein
MEAFTPRNFQVCGFAERNPLVDIKTRKSGKMAPEEGMVEAFEAISGAPVFWYSMAPGRIRA